MGNNRNADRSRKRHYWGKKHEPKPSVVDKQPTQEKQFPPDAIDEHDKGGMGLEAGMSSASAKKLKISTNEEENDDCSLNIQDGYIFISVQILCQLLEKNMTCQNSDCNNSHVTCALDVDAKQGFCHFLVVKCNAAKCDWQTKIQTSKNIDKDIAIQGKRPKEINYRMVAFARAIGKGHACLQKLSMLANSPPPMDISSYNGIFQKLLTASDAVAAESLSRAAQEIRNGEDVTDTAVSLDGTWQRRGRASHHGIVTCISVDTGKCLDFEVMSNICKGCKQWDGKDKDTEQYIKWTETHECHRNHEGSAVSMEPTGAVNIFKRSVSERKLRYMQYLGDGDTASFGKVRDSKPYGDAKIEKLECVGHVQKRVGSQLRTLKINKKGIKLSDGKALGGMNRLTEQKMNALQNYYGIAIRKNPNDLDGMKKAVRAVLPHIASSDTNPMHDQCPENSWCEYRNNPDHYRHRYGLPSAIVDELKPIFQRLASEDLLEKCLHGKTQNVNECLNKLIWDRCSKEYFVESPVIRDAVNMAVSHFNDGSSSILELLKLLNIEPGYFTIVACRNNDFRRIASAEHKSSEVAKNRRTSLRHIRKGWVDKRQLEEGELYNPGGF